MAAGWATVTIRLTEINDFVRFWEGFTVTRAEWGLAATPRAERDPYSWGDAMTWSPPPRVLTEAEVIAGEY